MEIGRLPGMIQLVAADGRPPQLFTLGQRLEGIVLKALADQSLLLAFGERQVAARSPLPLADGQAITVEVVRVGETVELRLDRPALPGAPGSSERYSLAALLNALEDPASPALPEGGDPPAVAAWRRVIAAVGSSFLSLAPGDDPQKLAATLRAWMAYGGMLLEAHLRQALEEAPSAEGRGLASWEKDLRVILSRSGDGGEGLPRQQVEFAYRWMTTGQAVFTVPMGTPPESRAVTIVVERDRDDGGRDGEPGEKTTAITVRVPSQTLGVIEARATWRGRTLDTQFFVETDAAGERVSSHASWLLDGLRPIFPAVSVDVRVDPDRVNAPLAPLVPTALPARSVVSVRA